MLETNQWTDGGRTGPRTAYGSAEAAVAGELAGGGAEVLDGGRRQRRRWYAPWRETADGGGGAERTGSLRRWLAGLGLVRERPVADAAEAEGAADGLRALTRGCEVWFGIEASQLEEYAEARARSAAEANLPRLEVQYEAVEEEVELKSRAEAVFHGWLERVRQRVQDALQSSTSQASTDLKAYEHEIGALEGALVELRDADRDLAGAEEQAAAGEAHLEVRPFFARWKYVLLIGLLVIVDWVANVPVFSELLPKDPGADAAWREIAARSETMGLWGGAYRMAARALHNLDASLLALGVIVFLVWLAHVLGESMRRLLAHSPAETPAAAMTIRAHRRQAVLPAFLGLTGIAIVIGVLWLARERLEATTAQRVAETTSRIEEVQAELAAARDRADLVEVGRLEQQAASLHVLREQRIDRADYALVISRMNLPILMLNLALAIAAAAAGYLVTKDSLRGVLVSPRAAALRERVHELRAETARRRSELARLDGAIERELHRADYLLRSKPLHGWEEKAKRLQAVVPRFRAENARLRGIDTANVAAFRQAFPLELRPPAHAELLSEPAELTVCRERHAHLAERAAGVLAPDNDTVTTTSA